MISQYQYQIADPRQTDRYHHYVYCDCFQHEILSTVLEEYKETTLKILIEKCKLIE